MKRKSLSRASTTVITTIMQSPCRINYVEARVNFSLSSPYFPQISDNILVFANAQCKQAANFVCAFESRCMKRFINCKENDLSVEIEYEYSDILEYLFSVS